MTENREIAEYHQREVTHLTEIADLLKKLEEAKGEIEDERKRANYNYQQVCDSEKEIAALRGKLTNAKDALFKVPLAGHNCDCLFCGFKDKIVADYSKALKEADQDKTIKIQNVAEKYVRDNPEPPVRYGKPNGGIV